MAQQSTEPSHFRFRLERALRLSLSRTSFPTIPIGESIIIQHRQLAADPAFHSLATDESCGYRLALAHLLLLLRELKFQKVVIGSAAKQEELAHKEQQLTIIDASGVYIPDRLPNGAFSVRKNLVDEIDALRVVVRGFYREVEAMDTEVAELHASIRPGYQYPNTLEPMVEAFEEDWRLYSWHASSAGSSRESTAQQSLAPAPDCHSGHASSLMKVFRRPSLCECGRRCVPLAVSHVTFIRVCALHRASVNRGAATTGRGLQDEPELRRSCS
nr:hypothetical protein CFP56_52475 [Quercus suber]